MAIVSIIARPAFNTLGLASAPAPERPSLARYGLALKWRRLEFLIFFAGIPGAIHLGWLPNWPVPLLLILSGVAWMVLRRDPTFDHGQLWNIAGMRSGLVPVVARALALIALLGLIVFLFMPNLLFVLVRRTPLLWASVMVFYPILSVYPQEFLFRALLFHRYRALFSSETTLILASASVFGLAHIIFGAWISVALTFVGGLLFALTYARTRSLLLVAIEHAVLGNAIFTLGLGQYFSQTGPHLFR